MVEKFQRQLVQSQRSAAGHSFQISLNLSRTVRDGIMLASLLEDLPDFLSPEKSERSRDQSVFLPLSLMY